MTIGDVVTQIAWRHLWTTPKSKCRCLETGLRLVSIIFVLKHFASSSSILMRAWEIWLFSASKTCHAYFLDWTYKNDFTNLFLHMIYTIGRHNSYFAVDAHKWCQKPFFTLDVQKWRHKSFFTHDLHKWRHKPFFTMDVQKWRHKSFFTHNLHKWRHKPFFALVVQHWRHTFCVK